MSTCINHDDCVDEALQKATMICHDRELRFTQLRRKVLTMIWANHSPVKAYDILNKLRRDNASAKPPTVYRSLDFLLENGLIHKVNSLNAFVGCSHPLKHNECYFLVCAQCGEIKECCNKDLAQAITLTTNKNKFKPEQVTLEIEGKCRSCMQKSKK